MSRSRTSPSPPNSTSERAAKLLSDATRLPLVALPLFLVVGYAAAGAAGLLWAGLCILLTSGLSLVYLAYLLRSGRVRDAKRISQQERRRPLWVVCGLHVFGWLVVTLLAAPVELRAVLLSYALATAAFALLTPVTKISLHAAGVSGAAACLAFVFGWWSAPVFALLPLVWWSRLELGRHTPPELALGTLVGGGFTLLAFSVV